MPIGGRAERAARAPALMNLVPSSYVFRKFSLFQPPHLPPLLIVMSFPTRLMTGSLKRHQGRWSRRSAVRIMSHIEGVEGVGVAAKEQKIRVTVMGKGSSRIRRDIGSALNIVFFMGEPSRTKFQINNYSIHRASIPGKKKTLAISTKKG